jgi:translocation and assembly module TamB
MKRAVIVISIVLVAALAAVEVYVQSHAFAGRIRASVVGPLKEVLGADAEIGLVRANLFPPYLEIRDVALPDLQGRLAIAVRKITIYINPLPLIFKKIRLPYISVLEPRILAERGQDGTVNLAPIIARISSNITRSSSRAPSGFSLMLRTISIRNARIEFKDKATSTRFNVSGLSISARANLKNDRIQFSVASSDLRMSVPAYPNLIGRIKAVAIYDRGRLRLDSLSFRSGDADLSLSGDIGPLPDAVLDLKGRIRSGPQTINRLSNLLQPPVKQKGSRIEASLTVKGKPSAPRIDGDCQFHDVSFQGTMLKEAVLYFQYNDHAVNLKGDNWRLVKNNRALQIDSVMATLVYERGGLQVRPFEIKAGDLTVQIQGRADPLSGFDMTLSALSSGSGQTLAFFTSMPVEGKIRLQGNISGPLSAPVIDSSVSAGPVTVRKILFNDIQGGVEYRDKKIKVTSVRIRQQSSRYIFEGMADFHDAEPAYTGHLQVLQSDVVSIVALFYKPIPIVVKAKGVLSFLGSGSNYSGSGYLTFDAGTAYGESFTRGMITASLTAGKIAFPQVTLYKDKGSVEGTGWIGFDGTYSANIESNAINLAAVDHLSGTTLAGDCTLSLRSSGSFSVPVATASLSVADLSFHQVGLGSVRATINLQNGQLTMAAGLPEGRTRLSVRCVLRKPYSWSADGKIDLDGIDPLQFFGKKSDSDKTRILTRGTISIRGNGLDLASLNGEALFPSIGIQIGSYRIDNESDAALSIINGRLIVKSLNFTGPGTRINIVGSTHLLSAFDLTVKGHADLFLLKLLYHGIEHAAGAAEVKLTIKGDWANPEVAGELHLQDGEIKIKDIPQRFMALNGKIIITQGRIVTDAITGEMGGGMLSMSGWAQLSGFSLHDFSTKATVENVTVRYPEGLTSTLSGNLYYEGDVSTQSLSGDITIKHARYDKRIEWKSMMVDIGRGLYQKKTVDTGWIGDTQINVRFHGSESIVFQNNFANMLLDVDVFLRGTVNHPQLLGRIEARRGTVYFRKNEFKILSASADFIDPNRINPVLDIQAETQVREYLIRLSVTGTAERASLTLISDPPLVDTDILSMLALGKRGSELIGKETGVGVGEAASFATGQFQDIFEQRARGLTGLDRFQIDPYVGKSDTSVPRVTVGKELVQNKLYVTYSSNVGATTPEQIFRIEYLLDKHFSLVGERNDLGNTGADIKYRFEFE